MPIIRIAAGRIERTAKKKNPSVQRLYEDVDLAWDTHRVYVLDKHEYFDPCTSSKGRHMMHGPSVIVVDNAHGCMNTTEYEVNDPTVWNWIGRCIKQGYLNSENLMSPCDERNVA